jgi:hypothetical protein
VLPFSTTKSKCVWGEKRFQWKESKAVIGRLRSFNKKCSG